ncbi:YciI family protein [Gryllotalpicola kribbensis]|uniref:YciI family protein n=1 Tax=Gryllotalpicola kribbensis TaxID=993084 RepID=UPI0031E02676
MWERKRFLVLHLTDAEAPAWSDEIDGPRMDAWLARRAGPEGWEPNGERVSDASTAREIAVRDGVVTVTDGPFPEFKEWFMGAEWIEASDMDEAVAMLSAHPTARIGRVLVIPALEDQEGK